MLFYALIRQLLFCLEPESSHALTLKTLRLFERAGLLKFFAATVLAPRTVMGIEFPNPIGLAAGLDKNGDYIAALSRLGFGFIEIGTVTPKAQAGNSLPRLFRLPEEMALINRLGFNNKGVDYLVEQVKRANFRGVLGINIGKNAATPLAQALDDYIFCLRRVYPQASYITINISSPNTPGLRDLQGGKYLQYLLANLKSEQHILARQYGRYVPLVVKIAPDLDNTEVAAISRDLLSNAIDGVIATNTTAGRAGIADSVTAREKGGLSGQALTALSTEIIGKLYAQLQGKIPIIGVGGIMNGQDAQEKWAAGADLLQLYTGFIYHGPQLIKDCVRAAQLL